MNNQFSNHLKDEISEFIAQFIVSTPGIDAALVSSNGFEIASKSMTSVDMERVAAVASTLSAVGNLAVEEFSCGDMYNSLVIQSKNGFLLVENIIYKTHPITFCIITSKDVVIAKVIQLAKNVVSKITHALSDLA